MNEMKIKIKGMTCGGCAEGVKAALSNVVGVSEVNNSSWRSGDIVLKTSDEFKMSDLETALDKTPYHLQHE